MPLLYHFGTFDVENYGDLLFPRIVESRLAEFGWEVMHCSPTGKLPRAFREDCRPSESALDLRTTVAMTPPDAVMVGGGQILRDTEGHVSDYADCRALAYPSLWLGAAELAVRQGVPLIVNAPGANARIPGRLVRPAWAAFAAQADYLAVRDRFSHSLFESLDGKRCRVKLVYDTALQLPRIWAAVELEAEAARTLSEANIAPGTPTAAYHLKPKTNPETAAAAIERIRARTGLLPVLIGIGPCHGDDRLQNEIHSRLTGPSVLLARPKSLRQVAALIAGSECFVGQSMHGYITAAAFGVPGLLIFPKTYQKCQMLADRLGLPETVDPDWEAAARRVENDLPDLRSRIAAALPAVNAELDSHWAEIDSILASAGSSTHHRSPTAWRWRIGAQHAARRVGRTARRAVHGLLK